MSYARPVNDSTPNITTGYSSSHPGIDYGYPAHTPVYASDSGTIRTAINAETRQWIANSQSDPYLRQDGKKRPLTNADYGNYRVIDHGGGRTTLYAHLEKEDHPLVKVGQKVSKGQQIGWIGSTGNSTGNHLHYEINENGVKIDPAKVLDYEFTNYSQGEIVSDKIYTEEEMSAMRKERDLNWDKYQKEIQNHSLTENALNKQIQDLQKKLAEAVPQASIDEAKELIAKAYEEKMKALRSDLESVHAMELAKMQVKLDEADAKISSLSKELLNKGDDWKARFTSRKFLLVAPTAIFNAIVAMAILFFKFDPNPAALATALTALNSMVAIFVIPESITDNNVRVELAKQ